MPLSGSAGLYRAKVRARGRDLASKGLSRALLFHLAEQVTVWRYHSSFIYSPTEGHLGCFQGLTIINKATRNICMQVFV